MSLNIKDEAVHDRVRTLARLTGESMTAAVDKAVSERLDRVRRAKGTQARIAKILRIGRECAALPVLDPRPADEILYDDNGLPK